MKRWLFAAIFVLVMSVDLSGQPQAYFDTVFTQYFRRNAGGWTAGDATISVPLPDKRVIWLFGDSYTVNVNTSNNTLPCLFPGEELLHGAGFRRPVQFQDDPRHHHDRCKPDHL
jgi:hypothetical protein